MTTQHRSLPIGVFDSGVGGLTVLSALRDRLPHENYLYLGDTARLPYGTKGEDTVRHYAVQAARVLVQRGVKMLVIACNTASAVALPTLRKAFAPLPVLGVVEPGALAACEVSTQGPVLITATQGTVRGGAYQRAIAKIDPKLVVRAVACPVFVALAEQGWGRSEIAEQVAHRYLAPSLCPKQGGSPIETLVLGCTHFPMLRESIEAALAKLQSSPVHLVDSGATTAAQVATILAQRGLGHPATTPGECRYLATDEISRFQAASSPFLASALQKAQIEWVDLLG